MVHYSKLHEDTFDMCSMSTVPPDCRDVPLVQGTLVVGCTPSCGCAPSYGVWPCRIQ